MVDLTGLGSIAELAGKALDRIVPDPAVAAQLKVELYKAERDGRLDELKTEAEMAGAQAEVNKVEAGSGLLFVAGWRPAVGWICALAIGFKFIGGPLLFMAGQALGHPIELPQIDTEELWPLLLGMLGLGAFRTVEKVKGAA